MLKVMKLMVAGLMVAIIALTTVALPSYAEEQPLSNENIQPIKPFYSETKNLGKGETNVFAVDQNAKYELAVYNETALAGKFKQRLSRPDATPTNNGTVSENGRTVVPNILTTNHTGYFVENSSDAEGTPLSFVLTFKGLGK